MTANAQRILADSRVALELIEEDVTDTMRRLHWVASVALLQQVWNALVEVDGRDPFVLSAALRERETWNSGDEHAIFREFIGNESLIAFGYGSTGMFLGMTWQVAGDEVIVTEQTPRPEGSDNVVGLRDLSPDLYMPWLGAHRTTEDVRDIIGDALDWWDERIDAIQAATDDAKAASGL